MTLEWGPGGGEGDSAVGSVTRLRYGRAGVQTPAIFRYFLVSKMPRSALEPTRSH
jgi:hypothetical protein